VVTGLLGGDRVSKHYYMNQQRVATDITINYDPNGGGGGEYAPSKGLDDLKKIVQELSHEPLDTSILALPSLTDYYPETAKAKSSNSQAEGSGSSGRILFWYHPDYLGNVDLVTEIDGFAHEFFIYNPWGEEMHQWNANTYAFTSPYRFNSKELDPETGLAYYGARYYQNKIGMWLSVDPLAHETFKPFVFTGNNPIILLDPDGREVILTGPLAPATFATLSNRAQSEGVILSMSNDGTLSYNYSGDNMQLSNSMRTLLNGIDNKNINVNVISKNSNITSSGGASHGGAFSGNTFTEIESGESFLREINANSPLGSESFTSPNLNRVDAIQDINPNLLNAVDVVRNTPGQLIMHEITEAIVGAEMSLALKRSAPPATKGNENFIYNSAHNSNRTEPQGPDLDTLITFRVYQDANNNIMVEHKVIDYNKNVIYILVDQY
jgi:RHS repeat-associated protein